MYPMTEQDIDREIIALAATAPNEGTVSGIATAELQELKTRLTDLAVKLLDLDWTGPVAALVDSLNTIDAELALRG